MHRCWLLGGLLGFVTLGTTLHYCVCTLPFFVAVGTRTEEKAHRSPNNTNNLHAQVLGGYRETCFPATGFLSQQLS